MCVNAGPLSVVLGVSDCVAVLHLSYYHVQHSDASGPEVFNVSKVEIHPEFDLETFSNNLAVVKLSQGVKLRESALPICLPTVAGHKVGGMWWKTWANLCFYV